MPFRQLGICVSRCVASGSTWPQLMLHSRRLMPMHSLSHSLSYSLTGSHTRAKMSLTHVPNVHALNRSLVLWLSHTCQWTHRHFLTHSHFVSHLYTHPCSYSFHGTMSSSFTYLLATQTDRHTHTHTHTRPHD